MPATLHSLPPPVSPETVRKLEVLLEEAKAGRLVGIAYVSVYNFGGWSVDLAGETKTHPVYTLGLVDILHAYVDHLAQR